MNQSRLAFAVVAFLFSAPGLAATCTSSHTDTTKDLSVATQEMRRDTASSTSCVTAQETVARASRSKAKSPKTEASAATKSSASGYVPKTKYDNTPWRFDMNQNGKRMTAEEFDAWMKAKGIRIATGKPAAAALDEKALANDSE